jgi:hypothetical protein
VLDVGRGLDALRRGAINDAEDSSPVRGRGDDDLRRIRGRAEDRAYFRDLLDGIENVDGKTAFKKNDKRVTSGNCARVTDSKVNKRLMVAGLPYKRGPGGLAECDAELHAGIRGDDRFVEIFDRFDKMGLTEDEVRVGRFLDRDSLEFHSQCARDDRMLVFAAAEAAEMTGASSQYTLEGELVQHHLPVESGRRNTVGLGAGQTQAHSKTRKTI